MAKIKNPVQFSKHFEVDEAKLNALGVFDPTLNVDAKLFVDPLLLANSKHPEMRNSAETYKKFFLDIIKLLKASTAFGDRAFIAASRLMLFSEIQGTCLGYGAASIRGSGFGPKLALQVTKAAKEIVDLGVEDPDLFLLLPLIENNIGPDLISDMTTNIIFTDLIAFNIRINEQLGLTVEKFKINGLTCEFPANPTEQRPTPVVLVPSDVLRDLPVANDWDEVCQVASDNQAIRDDVNALIGDIWVKKTRKDKQELKKNLLSSREAFIILMDAVHNINPKEYDQISDPQGILVWRKVLQVIATDFPLEIEPPVEPSVDSFYEIVMKIVEQFTYLIEKRGLWRELWHDNKRRPEKSTQRLFFAVADSYCKANNLDINPEIDTGTGQIDFKFSFGYDCRILVEIKLSDNPQVVHGYEKQLEIYKESEQTDKGVYVVVNVGKMGKKDERITKIKNAVTGRGEKASEIVFVDGKPKKSASKA